MQRIRAKARWRLIAASVACFSALAAWLVVRPWQAAAGSIAVSLVVTPAQALVDQPVRVRVAGLPPGRKIALEATTRDAAGRRWQSSLDYTSSRNGIVDTRRNMRLFWSMRPAGRSTARFIPTQGATAVQIRAVLDGRAVASAVFVRRAIAADVTAHQTTLAREGFVGTYFSQPPGPPTVAVLQLGGTLGGHADQPAGLLASHGYPTLSLGYFKEPGLPQTLTYIPLEYFAKALRWLAAQPRVDSNRVVVLGLSRGGEAALLLGATYRGLVHGVIACTTSSHALPGFPGPEHAWTLHDKPVPYDPIPVDRIAGPVLVTGGGKDQIWPSAEDAREIVQRARAHGRPDIVGLVYSDAGHGVGCSFPNVPVRGTVELGPNRFVPIGGTRSANARARAASWPVVLRFLQRMPR